MSQSARYRHRGLIASVAAVAMTAIFAIGAPARADEIGQDPTAANITGDGNFSVVQVNIPSSVVGFGGGVAYYPNAGVALTPWNIDKTWTRVTEPVLIIGGENDTVAPVVTHSIPFYLSLSGPKTYVELNGDGHLFPLSPEPTTSRALVSWFKRRLSNDTRFTPFTCGFSGLAISDFRTNAC